MLFSSTNVNSVAEECYGNINCKSNHIFALLNELNLGFFEKRINRHCGEYLDFRPLLGLDFLI
jgi:hypothetical protein